MHGSFSNSWMTLMSKVCSWRMRLRSALMVHTGVRQSYPVHCGGHAHTSGATQYPPLWHRKQPASKSAAICTEKSNRRPNISSFQGGTASHADTSKLSIAVPSDTKHTSAQEAQRETRRRRVSVGARASECVVEGGGQR